MTSAANAAALLTAVASAGVAILGGAAPARPSEPQVEPRLIPPVRLKAGEKGPVVVEMTLPHGWHVNSHKPLQNFLIPTTVVLTTSSGTMSEVRYPEPVRRQFAFSDEQLAVYEGTVRFTAELSLPATTRGEATIDAVLSYQPCNDSQCYPPVKKTFSATVPVEAKPAEGPRTRTADPSKGDR